MVEGQEKSKRGLNHECRINSSGICPHVSTCSFIISIVEVASIVERAKKEGSAT
jgi:hypothetical protein